MRTTNEKKRCRKKRSLKSDEMEQKGVWEEKIEVAIRMALIAGCLLGFDWHLASYRRLHELRCGALGAWNRLHGCGSKLDIDIEDIVEKCQDENLALAILIAVAVAEGKNYVRSG